MAFKRRTAPTTTEALSPQTPQEGICIITAEGTSATEAVFVLPSSWGGHMIQVAVDDGDFYIAFGPSGGAATLLELGAAGTSGSTDGVAGVPDRIQGGSRVFYTLSESTPQIHYRTLIGSDATLRVRPA